MDSFLLLLIIAGFLGGLISLGYFQYRKILREAKNYERALKMISLKIHIPPASDDIDVGNRDERDVTEEAISEAQTLYNVLASTATKGFKGRIYGQRHIAFEIMASKGVIDFYVSVPIVLLEVIRQAVAAAYPTARLEEVEDPNIFNETGKISGTIGGEFTLKKSFWYPIATYKESKRDAMRAILNAMSSANRDDGIGLQIMIRPASEGWVGSSLKAVQKIKTNRVSGRVSGGASYFIRDLSEALWKAPNSREDTAKTTEVHTQLTATEQHEIETIEEKTRYPGYETLVRLIVSSNTSAQSQVIMKNIVATFSLFDSPSSNGFTFAVTRNVEQFVTSFILRMFPQEVRGNILNSVELATLFHLPDENNIPTSQLVRQMSKQVDGPREVSNEGLILGYNIYRGIKKEIRLGTNDRRRHTYLIGQTGTGKSWFLKNLALQDMLDGKGFALIDPHGDLADDLLGMVPKERVEDVIYFNPGDMDNPIGLNLFEFDRNKPEQRDFLIQEAIEMLYNLYDPGHTGIIGPRYEHWFRHAAITLMSDPNGSSFIDVPQVFNDDNFAKEKLKYVTDPTTLDFWNKEMAQTSDYHKSEMLGWFVSKFGAFLSNEMMRNVIGQVKSGYNLRDIMDNKKILLVNLSKGRTGELNSKLLGMIFVMKFQAAAMARADMPEEDREDFTLYVDEFQNFATKSFGTILSEARKFRLNLVLANQFIGQLPDEIREAVFGNVGTTISGRIGTTDAEIMVKKFQPVFSAEDLVKLPNYESFAVVQINGAPSLPFSMSFPPPMGKSNPKLLEALRRLSNAKYGRPRAIVEQEIFKRLRAGDEAKEARKKELESKMKVIDSGSRGDSPSTDSSTGSSFLDEWLEKRKSADNASSQSVATNLPPAINETMATKENAQLNQSQNLLNDSFVANLPGDSSVSDNIHSQNSTYLDGNNSSVNDQPSVNATLSPDASLVDSQVYYDNHQQVEEVVSDRIDKTSSTSSLGESVDSQGLVNQNLSSSWRSNVAAQIRPISGDVNGVVNASNNRMVTQNYKIVEPDKANSDAFNKLPQSSDWINRKASSTNRPDEVFIDLRGNISHK